MKKYLCCFFLASLLITGYSQNYTLKGLVIDNRTKESLFYATVGLLKAEDSTSVVGVASDGNGKFEIPNVKQGDYLFQVSYIGYEMYRVPLRVEGENKTIQLDTVHLQSSSTSLATFTVVDKRPVYMTDGEKALYNVSEDPGVQTGTAADALQNAPGVEVDIEGNITLRGVSSVEIWINDRPSKMEAENLKTYLQQLPANSLERIEVINNPSARYSSEGTGGIINIITKTNIKKNSFISFGLNGSSRPMVSPWVSFVWANEKFSISLYSYGSFNKSKSNYNGYDITYNNNLDTSSYKKSTSQSDNFSFSGGLYINGSYTFDTMNTLSFWAGSSLYPSNSHTNGEQSHREYFLETDANLFNFANEYNSLYASGYLGGWYQHKFNNEGHNLAVNIGGHFGNSKNSTIYDRVYPNVQNRDIHNKYSYRGKSGGGDVSLNYNIPYSKTGEISAGASGSYSQSYGLDKTDTLLFGTTETFNLDSLLLKDTYTKSMEFESYLTVQQKFGNFTIKGGLRVQYRNFDYGFFNSPDNNVNKSYWGLFPSLHLSYRTKSMHNFNASYTRRINYPNSSQLTTFIEYGIDSYSTGNPDLLPTYTNSVDAGWTRYFDKFGSVGLSAYYRNSKDEISTLTDVAFLNYYGRIVPFSMPINSGHSYRYGSSANMMYKLKAFMNIRLNASVFHSYSEAMFRKSEEPAKTSNTAYSFRLNFWAKVWNLIEINASGNYRSKTKSLFNETKPTYSINCGLRADFWDRKVSVFVNVQDIFNWNKREYNITNPYYESFSSIKHTSRFISAGVTFRFGKIEMESQARTGGETE